MRISTIIAASIITFVLIWCGQFLYQEFLLERPLVKKLTALEGVSEVHIEKGRQGSNLAITLGEVENLAKTFTMVEEVAAQRLVHGKYQITYVDNRSDYLEEIYERVHYAAYEAIALGNFTDLAATVAEEALAGNVDYQRVTVDENHLFIQLHSGQAYLYQIIPRGSQGGLKID